MIPFHETGGRQEHFPVSVLFSLLSGLTEHTGFWYDRCKRMSGFYPLSFHLALIVVFSFTGLVSVKLILLNSRVKNIGFGFPQKTSWEMMKKCLGECR